MKHFLATLSNIVTMDLTKSHIVYQFTNDTEHLIKEKRDKLAEETSQLIE